jgi:hypothetical protein
MRSKRKRAKQRSRSVCLPPEDSLEAERRQLPFFEPYETSRLLADAARANNGNATDAAIAEVYDQHCRDQAVQLLRALGCDPNDKQIWPKAFMKLARLHHNVGRLVLRLRLPLNAKAWTVEDESTFLCTVYASVLGGLSEREAVRRIADAEDFPWAKIQKPTAEKRGERSPSNRCRCSRPSTCCARPVVTPTKTTLPIPSFTRIRQRCCRMSTARNRNRRGCHRTQHSSRKANSACCCLRSVHC